MRTHLLFRILIEKSPGVNVQKSCVFPYVCPRIDFGGEFCKIVVLDGLEVFILNPQSVGNLFEVKLQLFTFFLKGFS